MLSTYFLKASFCFLLQLDRKTEIYVQLPKINGFEDHTIAIDGMVSAEPLVPMVFQWFFRQLTIGEDGFRWLPNIGPTMRW